MSSAAAMSGPDMATSDDDITEDGFLGGALAVLQPRTGFRAGMEAVLLAASVDPANAPSAKAVDVGSGVGVAGLCLVRRVPAASVVLVERDPLLAGLARRNIARNAFENRATVVEADILASPATLVAAGLPSGAFGIVLSNPPWLEEGRGRASADPIRARANAMPGDALDRWARVLARIAAPGAQLVVVHRADAIGRVLTALDRRFGAIEILPLHPFAGHPARRILVRARKGSRAPARLLAGLILHEPGGGYVPAVSAVLRCAAPLSWQ
jgi:tRNA1(Val) A37 N6-methylase TrmN6